MDDRWPAPIRWIGAVWDWLYATVSRVLPVDRWFGDRGIGDRPGYHLVHGDPPPVHTLPRAGDDVHDPARIGAAPPVNLPPDPIAFMSANVDQFPHCDNRILHAPGECAYCDRRPEWQALRIAWGIAFTGQQPDGDHTLLPCPADYARPPGSPADHRRWYGNVAADA